MMLIPALVCPWISQRDCSLRLHSRGALVKQSAWLWWICPENISVLFILASVKLGHMWREILTQCQKLLWKLTHCMSGHWREAGREESIWMCGQGFWSLTKTTKMPQLVLVPTEKTTWPVSLYLYFAQKSWFKSAIRAQEMTSVIRVNSVVYLLYHL